MSGLLLVASLPVALAAGTSALTLEDYFNAALQRSEVVASQSELIRQAEERHRQASATLYPTLNGIATSTWQDRGVTDFNTHQNSVRLAATQPLFRGFREFAAIRQSQALVDAQGDDYRSARTQLFKDVAQNFYDVLAIEQDLKNLEELFNQYQQREKELEDRVRIGRSRRSETLTVQSSISSLHAQVEQRRAELSAAREVFAFLSGLPAPTELNDTETIPVDAEPLEAYLARLALRPDVRAARQRLTASQENISVVRGEHLPSLDLNANRYLARTGPLEGVDWDVQLALTVPLYAGGSVQSRLREAQSQRTQAELGVSQVQRQAEQEIRSLYQSVTLNRSQLAALEMATLAARNNYAAQQRDYRLGLVTNLEVLQALSSFQENQRALDNARFSAKLNYLRLQAAAVRRPVMAGENAP